MAAKEITELLQTGGAAGDSSIGLDSGLGLVRRDSVPYDKDAAAVDSSGTDLFVGVSVSGEARTFNAIPYVKGDTAATPDVDDLVVGVGNDGSAKQFTVASLATTLEGESFGTAAFVNHGMAAGEVPLNSDLGSAATRDVGVGDTDLVDNASLNSRVRGYDPSAPRLITQGVPPGSSNWGTSRMTPDGTKVWLTSGQPEATQHTLSTPYDMTTAGAEDSALSLPHSTQHILWNSDGTKAFFISNGEEEVYETTLATAYDLSTAGSVTTRNISGWSAYDSVDWNTSYFNAAGDLLFILNYDSVTGRSDFASYSLSTPYRVDTIGSESENIVIAIDTSIRCFASMSEDGEYLITMQSNMTVSDRSKDNYVVYKITTPYDLSAATPIQRGRLGLPMTGAIQNMSHLQLLDEGKKLVLNYKYSGDAVNSIVVSSLTTMVYV